MFAKKTWIFLIAGSILTCPISCEKPNENDNEDEKVVNPNTPVPDPEGTISLSMRNANNGKTIMDDRFIIDNGDNFTNGFWVSLGKVNGLGNITKIPKLGWTKTTSVKPGFGYVAYSNNVYYRVFVEDYIISTDGGVIGAEVKYQKPFLGLVEDPKIENSSLSFSKEGDETIITLDNDSVVLFDVSSSENWCNVSKFSSLEYDFLYNSLRISVPTNESVNSRTAEILVKADNKQVQISVFQGGQAPYLKSENLQKFEARKGISQIVVNTNCDLSSLSVSSNQNWCNPDLVMQDGKILCRISVDDNYSKQERQAIVHISHNSSDTHCDVSVSQSGATLSISGDAEKTVNANHQSVSFNLAGSPFSFNDDTEINVSSSEAWCSVSYSKGIVTCVVEDNYSTSDRKANISISATNSSDLSSTALITQTKAELSVSGETEITVDANTQTLSISLSGSPFSFSDNTEITAKASEKWCSVYYGKGIVTCTIDANTSESSRSTTISISASTSSDLSTKATIIQSGATLYLSKTEIWCDRTQSNMTITFNAVPNGYDVSNISSSDSWLTFSINNSQLTLRWEPTDVNREAYISFGGYSAKIHLIQNKYAVGDTYQEGNVSGTVLYMENGENYIYKNLGSDYEWSTETVYNGANNKDDGQANMNVIMSIPNWESLYPAFKAVDDLNKNGVSGWFIPAINQVEKYVSRLIYTNGGAMSSTETGTNNYSGWLFNNTYTYIKGIQSANKNSTSVYIAGNIVYYKLYVIKKF